MCCYREKKENYDLKGGLLCLLCNLIPSFSLYFYYALLCNCTVAVLFQEKNISCYYMLGSARAEQGSSASTVQFKPLNHQH